MCEGSRAGCGQDPHGGVCQAASYLGQGPHLEFICSTLRTRGLQRGSVADMLDVLNLHPGNPGFSRVKELLQKHHQSVSLKVNLPLIELEAAKEDLNRFHQECLHELGSGPQAQEALGEIARRLSGYNRRVAEIINDAPGVERPRIFNRISLAMAMEQPMEVVLLPGILDGLSTRLGMPAPGMVNPPASAREGVSR